MNPLKRFVPFILMGCLAACTTSPSREKEAHAERMDSAAFNFYSLRIIASDAANVRCDYGPQRVADYDRKIGPDERVGQNGSTGFYQIYPEMKCTWADGRGNRHKTLLDMPKLLRNGHVEWEHIEGETVIENEPLQVSPEFHIEIMGSQITVSSRFTVLVLGDRINETRRKLKPIPISRKLIELHL